MDLSTPRVVEISKKVVNNVTFRGLPYLRILKWQLVFMWLSTMTGFSEVYPGVRISFLQEQRGELHPR